MLDRGLVKQAELFVAGYTMWVSQAIESETIAANEADNAFTALDYSLNHNRSQLLSETVHEIILQGEHLHHYSDTSLPAAMPDLGDTRELALRVLTAWPIIVDCGMRVADSVETAQSTIQLGSG